MTYVTKLLIKSRVQIPAPLFVEYVVSQQRIKSLRALNLCFSVISIMNLEKDHTKKLGEVSESEISCESII